MNGPGTNLDWLAEEISAEYQQAERVQRDRIRLGPFQRRPYLRLLRNLVLGLLMGFGLSLVMALIFVLLAKLALLLG